MVTQSLSSFRVGAARLIFLGLFLSVMPILPMEKAKQHANSQVPARSAGVSVGVSVGEQPQELKAKIIPMEELAANIMKDEPHRGIPGLEDNSVFDENAKKELQLDLLHKTLDHTQTYVGSHLFTHAIDATNDLAEIERRQQLIQTLIADPRLFNGVTLALQNIAKNESAVLSYWNAEDPVFVGVQKLYFNVFTSFNRSKLALEGITLFDAGSTFKYVLGVLFLQGLYHELYDKFMYGKKIDESNVYDGLFKMVDNHNFLTTKHMHGYVSGCSDEENTRIGNNVYRNGTLRDNVLYMNEVWKRQGGSVRSTLASMRYAIFGGQKPFEVKDQNDNSQSAPFAAWGMGLAGTAFADYFLYKTVMQSKDVLKATHLSLEALRVRMIGVAECIKGIQKLEQAIAASPELQNQLPAQLKNDIALSRSLSPKMQEFVELINTATFKQSKSVFYLRGKVLYANKLFDEIKHELIPAMKALGEIDAYCAIARLIKASTQDANKFTFVTFANSAQAFMELDNCWIAVLDPHEAVANSVSLGQKHSGKMIITGPNGGGKSTHLKASGQAAWMAQAWGIAPARSARMSILDAVRTSFDPREDLGHGLSKFMAQKESMDRIQQFILDEPNKASLILLDEPYDGTVTDEIARRAGAFCDGIVESKNCLAIVATHIMPTLENPKMYSWYHVDIAEPVVGTFRRTFKLRRGLAKRWFNDQAWRGRFIDWLSIEMRKKALAQFAQ